LAYSALTVFFTSFAVVTLGLSRGQAAVLLAFFSLTIVVCALPAGLLGARVGRRRAIVIGLAVFAVALGIVGVLANLLLIRIFLVVAGAGWSLVVVNSLPMVLDSAPTDRVGAYTGMYYVGSQTAEVVGPLLVGALLDLGGRNYRLVSGFSVVVLLIALMWMRGVRRGEARSEPKDRMNKIDGVEAT
jgi:MFS family permease